RRVAAGATAAGYIDRPSLPRPSMSIASKSPRTAAKAKLAYVCSECGEDHSKWQGQCAGCEAWNTLAEFVVEPAASVKAGAPARRSGWAGKVDPPRVTPLKDVQYSEETRISTGIGELDRVLGGGLVRSEEHTSELQSRENLVCRLLLEKKKYQ